MENSRKSLVHLGTYKRFPSKTFQPDEHMTRDMILNLMVVVGFIFFGLILLHLFFGIASIYSFYAYIGIFVFLECSVIFTRLYIYLKKRIRNREPFDDDEDFIHQVVRISKQNPESRSNPSLSAYDNKLHSDIKIDIQKRNSF